MCIYEKWNFKNKNKNNNTYYSRHRAENIYEKIIESERYVRIKTEIQMEGKEVVCVFVCVCGCLKL